MTVNLHALVTAAVVVLAPLPLHAADCTYEYEAEVWKQDALLKGNTMDHTATRTRIFKRCGNDRKQVEVVDKCNHGACPGGDRWPSDAPAEYVPAKYREVPAPGPGRQVPIKDGGSDPKSLTLSTSTVLMMVNKMEKAHSYTSKAQSASALRPVGCDHFGYKATDRPSQLKNYGINGHRHVCNNDTFMQMGQVVTGKMPDSRTVKRICENGNYETFTNRDPKYAPSFKNVEAFVAKWGWEKSKSGGGGGGGGDSGRPMKRQN